MPPTTLRDQFPLSPRKFWKKIIIRVIPFVLLAIGPGVILSLVLTIAVPLMLGGEALSHISTNPADAINSMIVTCSILYVVILLLYAWYVKVYIRRYYYDANESYITIKKGVFAPAEIHVQYSKIQDVYVDQDIIDRMMGLYDVHLASATVASGIEAHIDGVEKEAADGLKHMLLSKLQDGGSRPSTPATGAPIAPYAQSQQQQPTQTAFQGDISSRTYPIVDAWMKQQAVTSIFSSLIITVLFGRGIIVLDLIVFSAQISLFAAFGISFVIVYGLRLLYLTFWRSNFFFDFLSDYIVLKTGVIAMNENHLPYRSVQDVQISQGIVERLFGIATVQIENAAAAQMVGRNVVASGISIPGQPLVKANEISEAIKRVTLTRNSSQTGL